MHVGYSITFQNPFDARSDAEVYERELGLALQAEAWGFDSLWTVEHHFTDYTMCPDPVQLLTYLAARTSRVRLGTGVAVLPWHDPMRLAEQVALLDNLSGGRLLLGIGRGIARVEYEGFRVDLDTSRDRFVESARVIIEGLERGWLEADGPLVHQPRRDIRPRPQHSFRGRVYAAAVSPDSMPVMAELGIGLLVIVQKPWATVAEDFRVYGDVWRDVHGSSPPAPICSGFVFVDRDPGRARDLAHRYIGDYYQSVMRHYAFAQRPHEGVRGYEFYDGIASYIERHGKDGAADAFVDLMPWGTPEQVIDKVAFIRDTIGMCAFTPNLVYAGMPWDEAERNVALFRDEVMPVLQGWPAPELRAPAATARA